MASVAYFIKACSEIYELEKHVESNIDKFHTHRMMTNLVNIL